MAEYNIPNIDIKGGEGDGNGSSIIGSILGPILAAVLAPKSSSAAPQSRTIFTPAVVRGLLIGTVVLVGGVLVYRAVKRGR